MKNYVQPGNTITLDRALCRRVRRWAARRRHLRRRRRRIANGAPVEADLVGVFDLTKVGSAGLDRRRKIYWDNTAKRCTKYATEQHADRRGRRGGGNGAGETIGRVRLNATF